MLPLLMVCHAQSNTPLSAVLLRHNLPYGFVVGISIKCEAHILTLLNLRSQNQCVCHQNIIIKHNVMCSSRGAASGHLQERG